MLDVFNTDALVFQFLEIATYRNIILPNFRGVGISEGVEKCFEIKYSTAMKHSLFINWPSMVVRT